MPILEQLRPVFAKTSNYVAQPRFEQYVARKSFVQKTILVFNGVRI